MQIRNLLPTDYPAVAAIYQQAIDDGNITLAMKTSSWEDWDADHLPNLRFVLEEEGLVLAWVALSPVLQRTGYQGVAELSVYVDQAAQGRGLGPQLMDFIIGESERQGIWTILSFIFPENVRSIKLHEKFGFRILGTQEKAAQLRGVWRDNTIMERRSKQLI